MWRTGTVGAVSVVATGASLLVLGVFAQVVAGGYALAEFFRGRVEVEVYLKDGLSRGQALALARELEEMEGVVKAGYIDKTEAEAAFKEMFGKELLDAVSGNPLPASIRVRLEEDSDMLGRAQAVAEAVKGRREVEGVDMGESWVASLDQALEMATLVGILLGGVLCLACAFAVSNTTKLMVLAQREAIEIMRLVGATGRFIRLTFLLGGAVQGCIGGLLGVFALWFGADFLGVFADFLGVFALWFGADFLGVFADDLGAVADSPTGVVRWFGSIPELPFVSPLYSVLGVVGLGTVLGIVGSWVSLNRVLNAVAWK